MRSDLVQAGCCILMIYGAKLLAIQLRALSKNRTTKIIDEERRQQFLAEGAHYESVFAITLTYLPPTENMGKATDFLFEGREKGEGHGVFDRILRQFVDTCQDFSRSIRLYFHHAAHERE